MKEMDEKVWQYTGLVAATIIVISIPLALILSPNTRNVAKPEAMFTGGNSCIECHQKEYRLWKGSDHDKAMDVATDSSVLGDFNNAEFTFNGKTSKFYKRDNKFFVYTEGIGGEMQEFEVSHTFGVHPLQQYLIPFENGKYQCLPIAWNTLKKEWFHMAAMVYNPEDLKPDNWLYWTNQAQNWNSMCAECHSTNLQKNYDIQTKTYHTTWVDINVNCEACHGPGSKHIEWAQLPEPARLQDINAALLIKTSKIPSRQYVESCAPCHSRRSSLGPLDHTHQDFLSYAIPQLPTIPYYHIDGQFLEEDYEYASFTQSKMYMHDVRCGDCHDPHSLRPKFEGNALCTQCHRADEYDTYNHHFHKYKGDNGQAFINKNGQKVEVGAGALCRDCHMPGKYFMGIDMRFDHSMRIPRPDLSVKLGTPNACTNCHDTKTNQWALESANKWYGENKKVHYGSLLAEANWGKIGADSGLLRMINNNLYPEIIRATAIGYLSTYESEQAKNALRKALNDPDPLLRFTAVENYLASDSAELFRALVPLLNDPVKSVRTAAANRLLTYRKSFFNETQYSFFQQAVDEYRISQEYVADFPMGRHNLGNYYLKMNDVDKAVENYREAITIDNLFYPAKINLAIIYYQQGKTEAASSLFQDIISKHPEIIDGYYYLALLYSEQKKYAQAIALLETASTHAQSNARIFYNLGLLYQTTNQNEKSETTFIKGLKQHPCNYDLLYALFVFHLNKNDRTKARQYLEQLKICYPNEKQVQDMYNQFKRQD